MQSAKLRQKYWSQIAFAVFFCVTVWELLLPGRLSGQEEVVGELAMGLQPSWAVLPWRCFRISGFGFCSGKDRNRGFPNLFVLYCLFLILWF
jgi:hypothetical protein